MIKPSTKLGKGNSLFYALIVAGFLMWNTLDLQYKKKDGWTFSTKDPPIMIVTPCFILIGVGLGVNLVEAFQAIANIAAIVTRNSANINSIAAKTGVELPGVDVNPTDLEDKLEK